MSTKISIVAEKTKKRFNLSTVNHEKAINSVQELADTITTYHWTPATFKDNKRNILSAKGTSLLAFDIDEGASLQEAREIFSKYKHVIVTSRSHQIEKVTKSGTVKPACDRFRVVLYIDGLIEDDATFKATWLEAAKKWPFIDQSCKDISRFYYAGNEVISVQPEGELVSIVEPNPADYGIAEESVSPKDGRAVKGALSAMTKDFIIAGAPSGDRARTLFKVLTDLKEQGYSEDEARRYAQQGAENSSEPWIWNEDDEKRITDVYSKGAKYNSRWPRARQSKSGEWIPDSNHKDNYWYLFETLMGLELSYDVMHDLILVNDEPISDTLTENAYQRARELGLKASRTDIDGYMLTLANERPFDPIKTVISSSIPELQPSRDYIRELFDTISIDYEGVSIGNDSEKEELVALCVDMFRRWVVAAVNKLYRPGDQNMTLIFLGGQGIGKSRWLNRLTEPFESVVPVFGEGGVDPANKDHVLHHLKKFIFHIQELDQVTTTYKAGALKDYLTMSHIGVRKAYGKHESYGKSICSFCASTNMREFLTDFTGNRRYLVIPTKSVQVDHKIPMNLVWAQARKLLIDNPRYKFWFDQAETQRIEEYLRANYTIHDELDELVLSAVEPGQDFIAASRLLTLASVSKSSANYRRLAQLLLDKDIKPRRTSLCRGYLINESTLYKRLRSEGAESRFDPFFREVSTNPKGDKNRH